MFFLFMRKNIPEVNERFSLQFHCLSSYRNDFVSVSIDGTKAELWMDHVLTF